MNGCIETSIHCPYCGESIQVLVDPSDTEQAYIEDCQVCCRPIEFQVHPGPEGGVEVHVRHENE